VWLQDRGDLQEICFRHTEIRTEDLQRHRLPKAAQFAGAMKAKHIKRLQTRQLNDVSHRAPRDLRPEPKVLDPQAGEAARELDGDKRELCRRELLNRGELLKLLNDCRVYSALKPVPAA
jgi:Zn-finger nucleic acid-binding protein